MCLCGKILMLTVLCSWCTQIRGDIDAVALAPYFDGFDASVTDVSEMLLRYRQGVRDSIKLVEEHAAMARSANMSLVAYEAGPGAPVGTFNDVGIGAFLLPSSFPASHIRHLQTILQSCSMHLLLYNCQKAGRSHFRFS